MSENKFFFEEDQEGDESEVTWAEHTETFMNVLRDTGHIKEQRPDFSFDKEIQTEADRVEVQHVKNGVLDIEFGIVQTNYVIHLTPLHPHRNLTRQELLNAAVRTSVTVLNKFVPTNLRVEIFLPRPDFEIKAVSFVIKEGADAWNLDTKKIELEAIPQLLEQITKICMTP